MVSRKLITIEVNKPYDYKPIPLKEIERINKIILEAVLNIANKFDGKSEIKIKIDIEGKGNA